MALCGSLYLSAALWFFWNSQGAKNIVKPTIFSLFRCRLGSILVPTWLYFGFIFRLLGRLGASWRHLGGVLGASWSILERLGGSLWFSVALRASLWPISGRTKDHLGPSWGHLGLDIASQASKKTLKFLCFFDIFQNFYNFASLAHLDAS